MRILLAYSSIILAILWLSSCEITPNAAVMSHSSGGAPIVRTQAGMMAMPSMQPNFSHEAQKADSFWKGGSFR